MLKEVVFEGHDASAKTPIIERLTQRLGEENHKVDVCAPFTRANERIRASGGRDIYENWISGERRKVLEGLSLLRSIVQEARVQASGILLFDRGWMTVLRSLDDVPAGTLNPEDTDLQAELDFWLVPVSPTVFGVARPEITRACSRFNPDIPWDIDVDFERRCDLAQQFSPRVVYQYELFSKQQDLAPFIEGILSRILTQPSL